MSIELLILEIGFLVGLGKIGLHEKAKRQQWAFYTDNKNPGSPIHIYPLDRLPDDVQIAWSRWDEESYNQVRAKEELKGDVGKPDKVPPPIIKSLAEEALAMPIRETWSKIYPPRQTPGKNKKVYDGKSQGLCPQAREILSQRFHDLPIDSQFQISAKSSNDDFVKDREEMCSSKSRTKESEAHIKEIDKLKGDVDLYKLLVKEKDRGLGLQEKLISQQEDKIKSLQKKIAALKQKRLKD